MTSRLCYPASFVFAGVLAGLCPACGAPNATPDATPADAGFDDAPVTDAPPGDGPDDGPGPDAPPLSGEYRSREGTRRYELFVPPGYRPGEPVPLVVVLHGCTQTAAEAIASTRFNELAAARNFIVLYPEQSLAANPLRCWNWFNPSHQGRDRGEPSLIAGMVNMVKRHWSVDPRRVYATGLSAGAAMTVVLGAAYPDVFASIAAHAGCQYGGYPCDDRGPDPRAQGDEAFATMGVHRRVVPVLVVQGTEDTVVPPANAERVIAQWAQTNDRAFDGADNDEIDDVPDEMTSGAAPGGGRTYTRFVYRNAANGAVVMERYMVDGMGHAYAGGCACGTYTDPRGPDATALSYDFFLAHPRAD